MVLAPKNPGIVTALIFVKSRLLVLHEHTVMSNIDFVGTLTSCLTQWQRIRYQDYSDVIWRSKSLVTQLFGQL